MARKEIAEEAAAERAYRKEVVSGVELNRKESLKKGLDELEQAVVDLQLSRGSLRRLQEEIEKLRGLV